MEKNMERDLRQLNVRQSKSDAKKSAQFGLMDRSVNVLILSWINVNRDMWIEAEKVVKSSIINKNKLSIANNIKRVGSQFKKIATKNNRLFYFGIDIILVGIILHMCNIGR